MYQVILFDLDGTLTDSGEGITKSVQYAIEKLGLGEYPLDQLCSFVGPPLMEQFMSFCDISKERAIEAVQYYRERYSLVGIYENCLYQGIPKLLQELKKQGYRLGVASSKPECFVNKILTFFSLNQYFDVVVGSELDGQRTSKSEVVKEAMRRFDVLDKRKDVILVGDRKYDILGARAMGIDCIAVSYGYGDMQELLDAQPVSVVQSVGELGDFFRLVPLSHRDGLVRGIWRIFYPALIYEILMFVCTVLFGVFLVFLHADADRMMQSSVWATAAAGVLMIPLTIVMMRMDAKRRLPRLRKENHLSLPNMLWMLGLGASLAYLVNLLMSLFHIFELFPSYSNEVSKVFLSNKFWVTFLCGSLIGPVAEECLFRGVIFQRLKDYFRVSAAIVLSAVFFGVFHGNMAQFLYASLLGMIFAWFMEYFQTIEAPICLHISANAWSFALSYFGYDWFKVWDGTLMLMLIGLQIFIVFRSFVYIFFHRKKSA